MGAQDAQCEEPYVIPNGFLPQFPSTWSTTIPTDGGLYSSPDTFHIANIAGPQNENSTEIPLKLTLGAEPCQVDNVSQATLSQGDSYWRCGCPREDHIAFRCDHTCWLNLECSLYFARDLSFIPESVVAILSVLTPQHTSKYTFYWSHKKGICGTLQSSGLISRSPF